MTATFNKGLTKSQFDAKYEATQPLLQEKSADLKEETKEITGKINEVQGEISKNEVPLRQQQNQINYRYGKRNAHNRAGHYYNRKARRGWRFIRRIYRRKRDSQWRAARSHESIGKRYIPQRDKLQKIKNDLTADIKKKEASKQNIINEIEANNKSYITLIQQKAFYDNREAACKRTKAIIDKQEEILSKAKDKLSKLQEESIKCERDYIEKCGQKQRDALLEKIELMNSKMSFLEGKQKEYLDTCDSKQVTCDDLKSIFDNSVILYNQNRGHMLNMEKHLNKTNDPYSNNCKDIYNRLKEAENDTKMSVEMTKDKESFVESMQSYIEHQNILNNYNSIKGKFNNMQNDVKTLNESNTKSLSKTSLFATKKQKYDEAIMTNILLTTLATSLLYYTFVEL